MAAQLAIFFERLIDDALKLGREIGIEAHRRDGSAIQDAIGDYAGCIAAEGHGARGHFVEDYAEAEEIGAGVELFAAHLLRRHVGNRTDCRAGAGHEFGIYAGGGVGQLRFARRAGRHSGVDLLGQAEI